MNRFVVVYAGLHDPSAQEERTLLSALKPAKVVDRMPGTLLVEGQASLVEAAVRRCKNWTFAQEGAAHVAPPHKRIRRAA